jgi:hypothetical protein
MHSPHDWDAGTIITLIFGLAATAALWAALIWTLIHGD